MTVLRRGVLVALAVQTDPDPVLKRNEARAGYRVPLWSTAASAAVALYPNLTTADPAMRPLLRDRRFRQALSLAIEQGHR